MSLDPPPLDLQAPTAPRERLVEKVLGIMEG